MVLGHGPFVGEIEPFKYGGATKAQEEVLSIVSDGAQGEGCESREGRDSGRKMGFEHE